MSAQLTLDVDRTEPHRPGRDLDLATHELWRVQQRALDEALRAAQASRPCRCARPLLEGRSHCLRCGREVAA